MLTNLDINSPVVQQLIKNNPVLAQQLGLVNATTPAPDAPAGAVTMAQVQDAITERLKGLAPPAAPDALVARLQTVAGQVEGLLKRALPADDFAALQFYVSNGSPGFDNLMKGDALFPLAQLLWETIRESQK